MNAAISLGVRWLLIAAVLSLLFFPRLHAADPSARPPPSAYLSGWVAELNIDDNPGLEDEEHSFAFGFGVVVRVNEHLDLGMDVFGSSAEFDNATVGAPFFGTISGDMDLSLDGLVLRGQGVFPLRWFEPFVGVGIGWGRARMSVSGTLLGFPGEVEEKDSGILYEFAAGAGFTLTRKVQLVLEYRDLLMEADFDDLSDGDVDIGGKIYALGLRFHF